MSASATVDDAHLLKFGSGQSPRRKEDPALLRGLGRFADDVTLPGQLYAVMVRSNHAHGIIRAIVTEHARNMPGVVAVFTGADLKAGGIQPMPPGVTRPNRDGTVMRWPAWYALPAERVRYVGEAIAFVVAETPAAAWDAAEAVIVEIDALPAVTEPRDAVAVDAPQVHEDFPGNVAIDFHFGDAAAVAAAFAGAAHMTRLALANTRIVVNPMEPRACVATFDPTTDRCTLYSATQGTFVTRNQAADAIGIDREKLRVITGNIGGSFGMKAHPFPEDICVVYAARALQRPVKWTASRSESFMADTHGRAHAIVAELALDKDGHFLALRFSGFGNVGAYLTGGGIIPVTINASRNTVSVYRTPLIEVATKCVFTNTVPVGAYRGNGRPEGNYYVERLIDTAAREMGIDPIVLRLRNHIRPEQIPYQAPSGLTYDSGDFPTVLRRAVELADWDGFAARQEDSRARGRLRGRGIGQFLEVTGVPTDEMGGFRFESDGTVSVLTGTMDMGQGHHSAFAQLVVTSLGIPFDKIRLVQGDSDQLRAGAGSGGSRSLMASGSALAVAGRRVIENGRKAAAHVLEAAETDITFAQGRFSIAGTDRGIGILQLAEQLRSATTLPPGVPKSLDADHVLIGGTPTFPNGCHIAEVEIDPLTGVTKVVRYTAVNDFGNLVNPMVVEGQLHGGIAQGIGQAIGELALYDESGQLVTGSFMDYAMPRADDVPVIVVENLVFPARTNELGVKGCGEAGCAGSLTSVMNAVADALAPLGIRHIDMPASPQHVRRAIEDAGTSVR